METALTTIGRLITDRALPWQFVATGHLRVNDRDTESHVGELLWKDERWATGPAIQVRDWVFCLAQAPAADASWVLCAYRGNSFYAFMEFKDQEPSDGLRRSFISLVVGSFWPILHPDTFDGLDEEHMYEAAKRGDIEVVTALKPGELAQLMAYNKTGGQ